MIKTELALRTYSTKLKCPSETLSNMISLDIKRSYDTRLCHKSMQRDRRLVAFVVCVQIMTNRRAALIDAHYSNTNTNTCDTMYVFVLHVKLASALRYIVIVRERYEFNYCACVQHNYCYLIEDIDIPNIRVRIHIHWYRHITYMYRHCVTKAH